MLSRLFYYLRETFRSLIQAKMVTLVSIFTVGLILFFMSLFVVGMLRFEHWLSDQGRSSSATLYCNSELTADQQHYLAASVQSLVPPQTACSLATPDAEYESFVARYGSEMLEAIEHNPFPAAILLKNLPPEQNLDELTALPGVETLVHPREWLSRLLAIQERFNTLLYIVAFVVSLILFYTISNTVKLTLYARKDLLINMHYIGASYWHIRTPFLLEGTLQGALGAMLASGALLLTFALLPADFTAPLRLSIPPMLTAIGTLLGLFGSFSAVRRIVT